jgi:hypothetical protein
MPRRLPLITAALAASLACALPAASHAADAPVAQPGITAAPGSGAAPTSAAYSWRWRVVCRNGHCRRVRVLSRW